MKGLKSLKVKNLEFKRNCEIGVYKNVMRYKKKTKKTARLWNAYSNFATGLWFKLMTSHFGTHFIR